MFTTLTLTAALSAVPTTAEPPGMDAAVTAFTEWAATEGATDIMSPACGPNTDSGVEAPNPVVCYGLVDVGGGDVRAVVALGASDELGHFFVPLIGFDGAASAPAADPATGDGFGDGMWLIGTDVQPGTFRAMVPADSSMCYWARLDATGEIIDNNIVETGQSLVTIDPSDFAIESSGCGTWEPAG